VLFLSHNISSLLFAPFLGGYVLLLVALRFWEQGSVEVKRELTRFSTILSAVRRRSPLLVRRRSPDRGVGTGWAFIAVALAIMVTAWFWIPALLEQDTVQLHLSRTTRNNDFHYNFLTWAEMIGQGPVPHDPDFLNPPMRIYLGIVRAVLMAAGVLVVCWPSKRASVGDLAQYQKQLFPVHRRSLTEVKASRGQRPRPIPPQQLHPKERKQTAMTCPSCSYYLRFGQYYC